MSDGYKRAEQQPLEMLLLVLCFLVFIFLICIQLIVPKNSDMDPRRCWSEDINVYDEQK
jgi:hypothetical protein